MRVMVLIKASPDSEAGELPSTEAIGAMSRYNDDLVNAGVMLAGDGLRPSANGVRVRFDGPRRTIIDGPFTEAKELVSGYWIWEVRSLDEAVEWLKRAPFDGGTEVEIRPVFEADDFGEAFTPELREREDRQRTTVAARQS
jgi:hypothetical protein